MHFKINRQIGREIILETSLLLINHNFSLIHSKALRLWASLTLLPAIASGCITESLPPVRKSAPTVMIIDKTAPLSSQMTGSKGSTLDILVFEDKPMHRLDAYLRIEDFSGLICHPASTGGEKIFFLCRNPQRNKYEWADINSYSALRKVTCDLEKEHRDTLTMTGECRGTSGNVIEDVRLSPLACEIYLESIRCDFQGTLYSGKPVSDVRIYLTYVNATCCLLPDSPDRPVRIINPGMLNDYDLRGFKDSSIVYATLPEDLRATELRPDCRLYCYPYQPVGQNGTRLVIEGKIDGDTYYWPIEIGDGKGVEANGIYTYRILLRRKGTCDPDIPVSVEDIDIELKVKPWTEKKETSVSF